jgi:hypothetical protein
MTTNHINAGTIVVLLRDRQPALLTRTIGPSFEAPSGCIMVRVDGAEGEFALTRVRTVTIHDCCHLGYRPPPGR